MPTVTKDNIFLPEYRGRLTEGITYNPSNDTLIWVDIISAELHRVFLGSKPYKHEVIKFESPEESIGAIGLTSNDDVLIVCGKYGVAKGNFSNGDISYFFKYPHSPERAKRLRSNDGIIDPWGHLWIGVMTDFPVEGGVIEEGKLYRIDCNDLSITDMLPNDKISIPNGLGFSSNGKKFYWTDSLRFTIWSWDYDFITNELSNRKIHIQTKELFPAIESPEPDGLTVTNGGEIYGSVFSTSTVVHYSASGEVLERFTFPCSRITCVIIGGKNNDEMYVTTCNENLKGDIHHDGEDLGGYIFKVDIVEVSDNQVKNVWGGT